MLIRKSNADEEKLFGALLTELSKTFDYFSCHLVIPRMQAYGFNKRALNLNRRLSWIEDELYAKNQIWTSIHCSWKEIKYGIPQGSILGLIFYKIDIYDLLFIMRNLSIAIFEDDTTSHMSPNNITNPIKNLEDMLSLSCSGEIKYKKIHLNITLY